MIETNAEDRVRTTDELEWWQSGVIYQIYPRSFMDSNGDGIGDLQGVIDRLDYLSDTLGVDAFWLSPFYRSPMKDFGYDVADYRDVDPMFGDLETFDRLLAEAHRRGLKVIIDYVPNHTSDEHPWFVESRSSRDNPRRDWYVWRDATPDGSPPNNWLSVFGGSAWEWDETTQQYYLHSFLKEQPDLDWRKPDVEAAMLDVMRFWLERGVDGFRIDVANWVMKDPDFRDNPPNPEPRSGANKPLSPFDHWLHIHSKDHEHNHEVYRRIRALLDEYNDTAPRFAVGETFVSDWNAWVRYYGEDLDGLHMPFNFELLKAPFRADAIRHVVDSLEGVLPDGAWPNYVLGSHDEFRLASRIGPEKTRLAAMLLLTLRGTPTIYNGDEIGMENAVIPPERVQDPFEKRVPGQGRDPGRSPMQWSGGRSAGFSEADESDLWLPLGPRRDELNVEAQLADESSLLNFYRKLLSIRRETHALVGGAYEPVDETPAGTFCYVRRSGDNAYAVCLNFSDEQQAVTVPFSINKQILTTELDHGGEMAERVVHLRPLEGKLLKVEVP